MTKNNLINPGVLEVICGPMFSGKTFELIHRVEKLKYLEGSKYLFFKPARDTRTKKVKTRFNGIEAGCISVKKADEILDNIDGCDLIAIDETQFFQKNIVEVIEKLLKSPSFPNARSFIADLVRQHSGATNSVIEWLRPIIETSRTT